MDAKDCFMIQSDTPNGVEVAFAPTALGVRRALGIVVARLRELAIPEPDLHTLELVLAETMNNVVEHAYVGTSDGEIELQVAHAGCALRCTIVDGGLPMPTAAAAGKPLPRADLPVHELREGGFGWHLIRELSRDLVYVRSNNRNRLTFLVPLTGDACPE